MLSADASDADIAVMPVTVLNAVLLAYVFDVPVAVTLHVSVLVTPYTSLPVITPFTATIDVACVTVTTTFRPPVKGPKVESSVATPPAANDPVIVRLIVVVFGPAWTSEIPFDTFAVGAAQL
jgi:hypothetical protein